MTSTTKKPLVYEVSIIRPLVIFLMVIYHAFCIYGKGWVELEGVAQNGFYRFLPNLISGFRIEMITLVGGYIYAYQSLELGRSYKFLPFVWKKVKRLLIPCFFFGTIYYMMFRFHPGVSTFHGAATRILSGVGHLWFLPLCFSCFVLIWMIDRLTIWLDSNTKITIPIELIILLFFFVLNIFRPFHLSGIWSRRAHFVVFFYGGYLLRKYRAAILNRFMKKGWIIFLTVFYFTLVTCRHFFLDQYVLSGVVSRSVGLQLLAFLRFLTPFTGLGALYLFVCSIVDRPNYEPRAWIVESSKVCYGVYVYHCFFLMALYYHTWFLDALWSKMGWGTIVTIPEWLASMSHPVFATSLLPWLVLAITLPASYYMTKLTLRTRFGRMLIG